MWWHTVTHGGGSEGETDAQTSAVGSGLNWRHRRFKWTRPFRWKTKTGFYVCAIAFQTQSDNTYTVLNSALWPEWWGNVRETSGRIGAIRRQDCCPTYLQNKTRPSLYACVSPSTNEICLLSSYQWYVCCCGTPSFATLKSHVNTLSQRR